MTTAIQWTNPKQTGLKSSVDAVYFGTNKLESFDLSLVFPPNQLNNATVTGYPSDWFIASNTPSAGNLLISGVSTVGLASGQTLFSLGVEASTSSDQALSMMYSGELNAGKLEPASYAFPSSGTTVPSTVPSTADGKLFPLSGSNQALGQVSAWIGSNDGQITALNDQLPAGVTSSPFSRVGAPLELKATVSQAASTTALRLYADSVDAQSGYWVHSREGTWVNLTSKVQGGAVSPASANNAQAILQFQVQDGGPLDADGLANGQVNLVGIVGVLSLDLTGKSSDLPTSSHWI